MSQKSKRRRKWKPLLQGVSKKKAWRHLEKLDKGLQGLEKRFLAKENKKDWIVNGIGASLFYLYLYKATGKKDYLTRSETFFSLTHEASSKLPTSDQLYSGFVGIAWLFQLHANGSSSEIETYILGETQKGLLSKTPLGTFGIMDRWVGFGIFALEMYPRGKTRHILRDIVKILDQKAEKTKLGTTWFSTKKSLPPGYRHGNYNLGMAHGVAGVISFLSEALKLGIEKKTTRRLLEDSIKWLLAQDIGKHFAFHVNPKNLRANKYAARLAWCYGDLGTSTALLNASRALKDPELERRALAIGLRAAEFSRAGSRVTDPFLCHGAGGAFHIFNYLYQETGEKKFLDISRKWAKEALELADKPRAFKKFSWDFVTGKTGLGLALLAGISKTPPDWDRFLLVSPYF